MKATTTIPPAAVAALFVALSGVAVRAEGRPAPAGDCAVARSYDDGTTMTLDAAAGGLLYIGLTNLDFPVPAVIGDTVRVTVDDGLSYRLPAAVIPFGFAVEFANDEVTRALLTKGKWIDFAAVEELRYSLDGSGEALAAVLDCPKLAGRPAPAAPLALAPAAPPPAPQSGKRYAAELDTYARAVDAKEDWADLKKALGGRIAAYDPVLLPRTRQRDGRRFFVMTFPGFASRSDAAAFCQVFTERRRRCVVLDGEG